MKAWVAGAVLLTLPWGSVGDCPADLPPVEVITNNPKFSGTCQVYKRGESPCVSDDTELGEAVGWIVVIAFGALFSLLTIALSWYEYKVLGTEQTSEQFNTAGRSIGPGLTAAVIVSQWTWAATLLMSSNMGWTVGISGPFWYASGATVQILLFATLAIQVKRRASHMHTFMEIVKARFGTMTHVIMICFALTTNIIVTSMLLLGGASTIEDLTGMSKLTAAFLIPILSCWIYTMYGGLRATFFASYVHTTVIFVMLIVFTFAVYAGSGEQDLWGSPSNVYSGLEKATIHGFFDATWKETALTARRLEQQRRLSDCNTNITTSTAAMPAFFSGLQQIMGNDGMCYNSNRESTGKSCGFVERSKDAPCCSESVISSLQDGSYCRSDTEDCISISSVKHFDSKDCDYENGEVCVTSFITMGSTIGLIFGITNIVGNFGTVFVDQSYWQSAVAAKPKSAVIGFLIGGMVWFAVPFCMATTSGLAGRALTAHTDINGMHGSRYITADDSGAGLTPARVLSVVLGQFGAFMLLLQLFMAITSTGSAEIIAVSSILTYDVYYEYVNPELKSRREKLRRLFYSIIPPHAGETAAAITSAEHEQEVRLALSEKKVKVSSVQEVLDQLATNNFFETKPTQREMEKLSGLVETASTDDEIYVQDLYSAVNKAVSSNNIEGLVLLRVSMFFTGLFALFMGFLAVFLLTLGMSLGHVYMSMGCIIGSAVGPASLTILMEQANGKALSLGCIGGLVLAIMGWTLRAQAEFDEVNYDTLMSDWPWVVGNLCAIVGGLLISLIGSLIFPDKTFRWSMLNDRIALVDDVEPAKDPNAENEDMLGFQVKLAIISSVVLTFVLLVLWPIPMHLGAGVFSEGGFTVWVALEMIWAIVGGVVIIVMPAIELVRTFLGRDKVDMAAPSKVLSVSVPENRNQESI